MTKKQFFQDLINHLTAVSNVTHGNGGFLASYTVGFNMTLKGMEIRAWSNDSAEDAIHKLAKSIYLSTFLSGRMIRMFYSTPDFIINQTTTS